MITFLFPILRFSAISAAIFCNSLTSFSQDFEDVKFDLVKEEAPIFIYERWITFPGKVPVVKAREVKSEFCQRFDV